MEAKAARAKASAFHDTCLPLWYNTGAQLVNAKFSRLRVICVEKAQVTERNRGFFIAVHYMKCTQGVVSKRVRYNRKAPGPLLWFVPGALLIGLERVF